MTGSSSVHPAALEGFSRGASAYARGRPEYPPILLSWSRDRMGVGPGTNAVDLGAGTGKFTGLLLKSGAQVTAVEPVAAMRMQLREAFPAVTALDGSAQALPLDTETMDSIFCAQSFHWFAARPVLEELRRVLVPGGSLGLIWNVRDESVDWVAALSAILEPYRNQAPHYSSGAWREPFEAEPFSPLVEEIFPYQHQGASEAVVVDRSLSVSFIAALPAAEKAAVAARIRALIASTAELRGRPEISFPYRTHAYSCTRR